MHLAFENYLPLQAGQVRIVANKVIEFVGIVTVWHLVIGHGRGQIFRFMNGDVNIGLGMRVAIDKNVTLDRQRTQLTQRPFLLVLATEDARPRLDDVFCQIHPLLLLC